MFLAYHLFVFMSVFMSKEPELQKSLSLVTIKKSHIDIVTSTPPPKKILMVSNFRLQLMNASNIIFIYFLVCTKLFGEHSQSKFVLFVRTHSFSQSTYTTPPPPPPILSSQVVSLPCKSVIHPELSGCITTL